MRLLAVAAVLAGALLVPSGALAAPVLSSPAGSTLTTNGQIHFAWSDSSPEDVFRVVTDAPVIGSCQTIPTAPVPVSGDIVPPFDPLDFVYIPPANGTACYWVQAVDAVPTTTYSDPVLITYDTPLAVSVTTPTASSTVHGTSVTVSATATDPGGSGIARVDFYAQGSGAPVLIGSDSIGSVNIYSAAWNTTLPSTPDDTYSVWAVAVDSLTLQTTSAAIGSVHVDNTHPVVSVTAPTASTSVHGPSVTVSANASDGGSGMASVQFFADDAGPGAPVSLGTVNGAGPYSVTWNTLSPGAFPDGTYTVSAVATDNATLTTTSTLITNVRVDNTGPTGSITAPTAGALLHGTVNLTANALDATGVNTVTFEQSSDAGAHWTPIGTDSDGTPYSVNWPTAGLNGAYSIHAVLSDVLGNPSTSTAPVNVTLDNTAPSVILGGIANNAEVHGPVDLSATAADTGGSGVFSVQFGFRPEGSLGSYSPIGSLLTAEPFDATWSTAIGAPLDGYYQIRAQAIDVATNPGEDSVTHVLVDNHAPNPPAAAPTGLSPVSASPTISFIAASDVTSNGVQSGIDHYDVYRDNVKVNAAGIQTAGGGPFTWTDAAPQSLNPPSGTPAHAYSYTVKAVDGAGNSSAASAPHVIVLDAVAGSAPTSVTALASPTSQVPQVSWGVPVNAPFAIDHYNVYRNSSLTPVGVVNAPATTFTDVKSSLDLAGGDGSYTYQVVAAAADGTTVGVASAAVTVIYDTTAPNAPAGVAASPTIDGSVAISWTAATDGTGSGIARYVVRRSLSSVPPASVADGDATCQGAATSCIDTTALNGKLYSYAVFAIDRAGNTSLAGIAPAVTARDQLAPAAPSGLSATPSDASVALKWTAAGPDSDVAGYVLVAKQGTQAPTSETDGTRVCPAIVAASTNCIATALTNGATYTFGLFALDEALNRSLPAVVSAAPNGKITDVKAPAAVSKLHAKVSGHKVTLTWKNPADHDFDHVEITVGARKPAALKASKRVYSGKGTKATTTLGAGQSRWFVVVAYDAVGNASAPASVHVTIPAASKFGPPPRAKVHGKVKLSWPVAKGAKYYNVQVYAGKKRILVSWPAGRALQLPKAKLKRGTKYTWYVWPGLGAKAKAHYGKLIGRNVFTFTG